MTTPQNDDDDNPMSIQNVADEVGRRASLIADGGGDESSDITMSIINIHVFHMVCPTEQVMISSSHPAKRGHLGERKKKITRRGGPLRNKNECSSFLSP